jgi:phenylacetate-CoA oxygenase PaaI subunit
VSQTFLSVESLDPRTRDALRRQILTLADSKRLMGIRYSDWLIGAPTIETGIAASSMAQDEWGHARLLYAMLKELGIDPVPVEHDRPAEEYASVGALDVAMPDWAALVAAEVVVDGAITAVLESFAAGSFEPAVSRVPKMLAEEEFHVSLAAAWYKRLAASTEEARRLLTEATRRMLPPCLTWVGADDDAARALVEAGVLAPAEPRLGTYRDRIRDLLARVDVDVDTVEPAEGWDESRGRTPGQPDDHAVERARGDKNRALFVE